MIGLFTVLCAIKDETILKFVVDVVSFRPTE